MDAHSGVADDPLRAAAARCFGVDYLFPYQRLVIANTLEAAHGDHEAVSRQIVLLPTGAGKSLCFQLPAALLGGLTVVVYPLLSLIADQARRLSGSGLAFAALTGRSETSERRRILNSVQSGDVRVLLTNPESLASPAALRALHSIEVAHLVVDEAHCICEWGESFRPAYRELGTLAAEIKPRVITAFTATASAYVLQSIRSHLFSDQPAHMVSSNPDRPNIRYYVLPAVSVTRALEELLARGPVAGPTALGCRPGRLPVERPAIVFCRSRAATRRIAACLRRLLHENEINFYHAGLDPAEKEAIERWFFSSRNGILVATCAYGMGVDKPDIRSVIHPETAPTVESFLQESGRAGRDGRPALSITLSAPQSPASLQRPSLVAPAEREAPGDAPPIELESLRAARLVAMRQYLTTDGCRRDYLLEAMGAQAGGCSGCDRCERLPPDVPEALPLLRRAVRRAPRRMNRGQLARLLAGRLVGRDHRDGLHRSLDYASLCGWTVSQIEELIDAGVTLGNLHTHRRGPWRSALDVRRAGRCPGAT